MMFNPDGIDLSNADFNNAHIDVKRSRRVSEYHHPNTHEDVQVLNLQGFMDASSTSTSRMSVHSTNGIEPKKKSKRRRSKKYSEGDINVSQDRRRRYSRSRGRTDEDDDLALRDLDELDDEFSGLVLGPKTITRESTGIPITMEEATELRQALTGNPASVLPQEWMTQNFEANKKPNLPYGLMQKKVGQLYAIFL